MRLTKKGKKGRRRQELIHRQKGVESGGKNNEAELSIGEAAKEIKREIEALFILYPVRGERDPPKKQEDIPSLF